MRAAAIQFDVKAGQVKENQTRAAEMLREAARQGVEMALLPELWNCGYQLADLPVLAESMRGESMSMLRQLAKELNMVIISGSIAEKKDGKYYNTEAVIDPSGEIVAKYRKAHLYPHGLEEHLHFTAGDQWVITEQKGFQIGLMICYDVIFPEFARNLALRGAQILTIPSESTVRPLHIFRTLTAARALENHCYVIFANCSDSQARDTDPLAGHSMIISPRGEIIAKAGSEEAVITAELKIENLEWFQHNRNYLNDRRPILDEIDESQL